MCITLLLKLIWVISIWDNKWCKAIQLKYICYSHDKDLLVIIAQQKFLGHVCFLGLQGRANRVIRHCVLMECVCAGLDPRAPAVTKHSLGL